MKNFAYKFLNRLKVYRLMFYDEEREKSQSSVSQTKKFYCYIDLLPSYYLAPFPRSWLVSKNKLCETKHPAERGNDL